MIKGRSIIRAGGLQSCSNTIGGGPAIKLNFMTVLFYSSITFDDCQADPKALMELQKQKA